MSRPTFKSSWRLLIPFGLALFFLSLLSGRTRRAPWYEQWAWNSVSPLVSVFTAVKNKTASVWTHYFYLVGVSKKNDWLQKEVSALKQKQIAFRLLSQENDRLKELLQLKETSWPESVAARVIALDPRSEFKSIRINKGSRDGIAPDMPVVSVEGLVGKVGPVFKRDAIVLLIVDPASYVDVAVERSSLRALLRGAGLLRKAKLQHGFFLTNLEYLKRESDIRVKDAIVTSGLDGFYPRDVLAGEVMGIEKDASGLFLKADVLPAVDFAKLKEVLVLKTNRSP